MKQRTFQILILLVTAALIAGCAESRRAGRGGNEGEGEGEGAEGEGEGAEGEGEGAEGEGAEGEGAEGEGEGSSGCTDGAVRGCGCPDGTRRAQDCIDGEWAVCPCGSEGEGEGAEGEGEGAEGEGEGEGCYDMYECMVDCGADGNCQQACFDDGSPAAQTKMMDMLECWDENCAEAETNEEFSACVEQSCLAVTNTCLNDQGGGGEGEGEGEVEVGDGSPGSRCLCDTDCDPSGSFDGVCVYGVCMFLASAVCSADGSQAECPRGSRCWGDSAENSACWVDCNADGSNCAGECDGDGSCVPTDRMDCDSTCGSYCSGSF